MANDIWKDLPNVLKNINVYIFEANKTLSKHGFRSYLIDPSLFSFYLLAANIELSG